MSAHLKLCEAALVSHAARLYKFYVLHPLVSILVICPVYCVAGIVLKAMEGDGGRSCLELASLWVADMLPDIYVAVVPIVCHMYVPA